MQDMPDNFVDLCISSPPYNLDIKYNNYKDKRVDYIDWQIEIWNTVCQKLKDTGQLFFKYTINKKKLFYAF